MISARCSVSPWRSSDVHCRSGVHPPCLGWIVPTAAPGRSPQDHGLSGSNWEVTVPTIPRLAGCIGLWAALLLPAGGSLAQGGPQPPCEAVPSPTYPASGELPAVHVWAADELGADWMPPACTGWRPLPFRMLVATAARFRHKGSVERTYSAVLRPSPLSPQSATGPSRTIAGSPSSPMLLPWIDPMPMRVERTSASLS